MVPLTGLEPVRHFCQRILSPRCLPFHHSGMMESRAGTDGWESNQPHAVLKTASALLEHASAYERKGRPPCDMKEEKKPQGGHGKSARLDCHTLPATMVRKHIAPVHQVIPASTHRDKRSFQRDFYRQKGRIKRSNARRQGWRPQCRYTQRGRRGS